MKRERLLNGINELDDALIENAAPRRGRHAHTILRQIGAAAACFLLGFCASLAMLPYLTVEAGGEAYRDNVPEMILMEDLDAVIAVVQTNPDISEHGVRRLKAFFERIEITEQMPESARAAILKKYPIAAYAPVYVLEETITELERHWVDVVLQMYGGYTAEQLEADVAHINRIAAEHGLEMIEFSSAK